MVSEAIKSHIFDHVAATLPGRHLVQEIFFAIQHADAGRRKHLMAREDIEIGIQSLHVYGHMRTACAPSSKTRAPAAWAASIICFAGVMVPNALETWVKANNFVLGLSSF